MIESSNSKPTALIWLRRDLRIHRHPAFAEASKLGLSVIAVYIHSDEEKIGAASQWWLHHSLKNLQEELKNIGISLVLRKGRALKVLKELIAETRATYVFWSRLYEPSLTKRDEEIKAWLKTSGVHAQSFTGNLLLEPWQIQTQSKTPYKVFTPFYNAALLYVQNNLGRKFSTYSLENLKNPGKTRIPSLKLDELKLLPQISWDTGFRATWNPGAEGARDLLKIFYKTKLKNYKENRDFPSIEGTSGLSAHLHFGEIDVWEIWEVLKKIETQSKNRQEKFNANAFLRQIFWRDFAHHILFHFPDTAENPLDGKFKSFPWKDHKPHLKLWQKGQTGYPIVDAGMRELWASGWMHNRVRMIVASFLTKHLMISWRRGAEWFFDTLVDADLANNTLGWQWAAGCGADAAPYFRIFNPILQSEKFDPEGAYIRKWVPELREIPAKWIHKPWEAPEEIRSRISYPTPIILHGEARARALEAYKKWKI